MAGGRELQEVLGDVEACAAQGLREDLAQVRGLVEGDDGRADGRGRLEGLAAEGGVEAGAEDVGEGDEGLVGGQVDAVGSQVLGGGHRGGDHASGVIARGVGDGVGEGRGSCLGACGGVRAGGDDGQARREEAQSIELGEGGRERRARIGEPAKHV